MAYVTPKHYYPTRDRSLRLIVMHTMESPEAGDTAESVANWFAGPTSPVASAHACIDNDSVVLCLPPTATAFAAPGCNADGYQIELAGRAGQGAAGWADAYSQAELQLAAAHARSIAQANGIPLRHLSNAELAAGQSGFIGHDQASQVYGGSDHWDPGPDFPWDQYMSLVTGQAAPASTTSRPVQEDTMHLIQTKTPWGSTAYALVTETTGARALGDQEAQAYNAMLGRFSTVPWDHYQLLIRQAWERRNALVEALGGTVTQSIDAAVQRVIDATKEA